SGRARRRMNGPDGSCAWVTIWVRPRTPSVSTAARPRVAILAEGQFARATAKTAIGVLRYAPYPIVAVVDSTRAGTDAAEHVGVGAGVPIVASVDAAIDRGAEVLLIGTAAAGGRIADAYRPFIARALERGLA